MNVIMKSHNGLQSMPITAVMLSRRRIFLTEAITMASANVLVQQLLFLEAEDPAGEIQLCISSPGGEVNAGLLIYDQLRGMPNTPVNLYCTGLAASMAAMILSGGQKGRRLILPHSKVMIHAPYLSGGMGGDAESVQRTADSLREAKAVVMKLLGENTGRSAEEIELAIRFDNTMGAEEAVRFGICDRIVSRI